MTPEEQPGGGGVAVQFGAVHRVLAMFAEGIAGRHVELVPCEPHADHRAHCAHNCEGARDDAMRIHLPAEMSYFRSTEHNNGAYRIAVLHQIGHRLFGTYTLGVQGLVAGSSRPGLLRRVFETLEDLRVDLHMGRRFPGARSDLRLGLTRALSSRPQVASDASAAEEALTRYSLGIDRARLERYDPSGLIARVLDIAQRVTVSDATVSDSAGAATAICALIDGWEGTASGSISEGDAGSTGSTGSTDEEPTQDGEGVGDALGGIGADEAAEGTAHPGEEDPAGPGVDFHGELERDASFGRGAPGAGSMVESPTAPWDDSAGPAPATGTTSGAPRWSSSVAQPRRSFRYDEWDHHRGRYLSSWCRVHEFRLRGDDAGFIAEVRRRHASLAHRIQRLFASIRSESWLRVHRTSDGDELGLDALIEAVVDRHAGRMSDEYLYVRRDRARRDVAAAFLIDMSASTSTPLIDPNAVVPAAPPDPAGAAEDISYWPSDDELPPPPRRTVLDVAKESMALMGDALHRLGDCHAIYGFSGNGREDVEFHVAKEFGDVSSPRTFAALAAMRPRRYTRMGPAIRHTAFKLSAQPMRTKLMIIVSDGYPQDVDYGPDRADHEYGLQDTARALQEAERAGVSTFCITIDPAGHDYLRRMCGEDRYLVIDDVTALPEELVKVYRALTSSRV